MIYSQNQVTKKKYFVKLKKIKRCRDFFTKQLYYTYFIDIMLLSKYVVTF